MTSRFTMALHALGMIAWEGERAGREPTTSATLARSINTNPVVVRRVLSDLRRAGLVDTRRGVGGGVVLAVPPARITLRRVWEAVQGGEPLIARHPAGPNLACPVACRVAQVLEGLYGDAEAALKESLAKVTLAQFQHDLALPARSRRPARRAQVPTRTALRAR